MKFTVDTADFSDAVDTCKSAIATRTTKPVLTNIKLVCDDDSLYLFGTDLEVGVRCKIPATVTKTGSTTISADKLAKILKSTDSETIEITADNSVAKLKTSSSKYDLPVTDPDEFPEFEVNKETTCLVSSQMLHDMIKKVSFAAEKQENTRYSVCCVMFEVTDKSLRLVATDTKRLAISENSIDGKVATALIPLKTIKLLLKLEGNVRIAIGNNDATFEVDDCVVYSRLIEGKFPPYKQFMPKTTNKNVIFEPSFGDSVRRAAICADDNRRCNFTFTKGNCGISSQGVESGRSDISVDVGYDGDDFEIGFDWEYVTDVFKVTEGPLTAKFTKENDRVIFNTTGFECLVVPMIN